MIAAARYKNWLLLLVLLESVDVIVLLSRFLSSTLLIGAQSRRFALRWGFHFKTLSTEKDEIMEVKGWLARKHSPLLVLNENLIITMCRSDTTIFIWFCNVFLDLAQHSGLQLICGHGSWTETSLAAVGWSWDAKLSCWGSGCRQVKWVLNFYIADADTHADVESGWCKIVCLWRE